MQVTQAITEDDDDDDDDLANDDGEIRAAAFMCRNRLLSFQLSLLWFLSCMHLF